jgi:hypothetical protein
VAVNAAPGASFEAVVDLGTTGLTGTLGLTIIDNLGNDAVARSTASIIEDPAGSGLYQAVRTAPSTPGQYSLVWDDADTPTHYAIDELVVSGSGALGPPGTGAGGGPCTAWITEADLVACCDVEDTGSDLFDQVIVQASEVLFDLSARQYPGLCEKTVRPCRTSCGCGWQMLSRGYVINWTGESWLCDGFTCGCAPLSEVRLSGYPVQEITQVLIDGAVVAANTYRLHRSRYLIRMRDPADPDTVLSWPGCQHLDLEDTEDGTWSVTYTFGQEPPEIGKAAAAQLACELFKQCQGEECQLPKGVTRVTRQGITVEKPSFAAWAQVSGSWATGMPLVDAFLSARNPSGLHRRPTVYTPSATRDYAA